MKEFSNKTPYLAPQLTVVEFRMEVGYGESVTPEIDYGVQGRTDLEVNQMIFLSQQDHSGFNGSYMGGEGGMGYYGGGGGYFSSGESGMF